MAGAEARYREAVAAWERVPEWVAQMGVDFTARSASMHIRLEMKRTEELSRLKRSINATLAEGGLAAALGNLAELLHASGRADEAEPLYRRAREMRATSVSHREAGVAVICDNLADLLEEAGRDGRGGRAAGPGAGDRCRSLPRRDRVLPQAAPAEDDRYPQADGGGLPRPALPPEGRLECVRL